jgi:hypothetical protein
MKTLLIFLLTLLTCAHVEAGVGVTVSAECNVFGAGHSSPNNTPDVGSNGGGIPPVMIPLTALSNSPALQFQASGTISFCPACGSYGPDGNGSLYAAPSYNGISGITNSPARGLIAVFTGATEPANPAPASLDFSVIGTNFATLSPQLNQLFFIGAGVITTNDAPQTIFVPPGATQLYLGFVDGDAYPDSPDAYGDNSGSLAVNVSGLPVCDPPPSGLVAWWPADGNALDIVGGHNGTLEGGVTFSAGEVGQSFLLDGSTSYVDVTNASALNPAGPFSVECWVNGGSAQNYSQCLLVDKSHGFVDGTGWALQTDTSGNVDFFYGIGGSSGASQYFPYVATTTSVLDSRWHHLVGVWTGTQLEIYLDGQLQNSLAQTTPPAANTRDVEIGSSWGGGTRTRYFGGYVDEVSYYDVGLSAKQVAAIYAAGSAGKCQPALLSIQSSGPAVDLSFQSFSNQTYTLQNTTNLSPATWINYTNLLGNGSRIQTAVPVPGVPQQFFRTVTP